MNSTVPVHTLVEGVEKVGEKIGIQISAPAAPKKKWKFAVRDIFAIIGWLIFLGFSGWYIYDVSDTYEKSKNQPTTTISYVTQDKMEFPGMTICNYNAKPPSEACDYCDITFTGAYSYSSSGVKSSTTITNQKKEIVTSGLKFNCYFLNNEIKSIKTTSTAGFGGSISLNFKMKAPTAGKYGAQISFHEIAAEADIFAETQFASPYKDNMYTLNKVTKNFLDGNSTTLWEPTLSQIKISNASSADIIISVSYGTLDVQVIDEVLSTDIPGLLGSIAGIIGLTMGLDIMKMLRGLLEVPYAVHQKSIRGIWKIFN
ncbi:predicted protein [Naegleria gruberi]|uniref:Predicted protein n=1 Tax=Naegleria gruberi TaxID=5762 RepID=D2V787_NAEGR|nr:uncharacterized protein NAEGRDRAFT_64710 [Naegleria gruberi]EFC47329.1 predicted protein [Naegleria gruberi]|eukprot:XP_002680073.1 predicted protein [Naegleria gruberi strain NEG-M]